MDSNPQVSVHIHRDILVVVHMHVDRVARLTWLRRATSFWHVTLFI